MERSFWGWGYRERFPDAEARAAIGAQIGALLGVSLQAPKAPPALGSIGLRPSRIDVPPSLAGVVDCGRKARIFHTHGRGYPDLVRGFRGDFAQHAPDAVACPSSEADLERVLEWCAAAKLAVIPYGGGTSVVGGVDASLPPGFGGVVSLDVKSFDQLL
jgi:alkyldihydroxyacetonephosphate synthase